jgi:hypothetical protein
LFFCFILLYPISLLFAPNALARDVYWLGLGLGFNAYEKIDIDELHTPWIYNWGAGDSYMFEHTDHNNPDLDYPSKYIPTFYSCGTSDINLAINWIEKNQYVGPAIVFNEPDNSAEQLRSCTTDGVNPVQAVIAIDTITTWRDDYFNRTGNYVDLIMGGTFYHPGDQSIFWLDKFKTEWDKNHTTQWPDVEGLHFHLYLTQVNYGEDYVNTINTLKNSINGTNRWEDWLEANPYAKGTKDMVWITEVGVLGSSMSAINVDKVAEEILPFLYGFEWIDRVFWFSHSNSIYKQFNKTTSLVDGVTKIRNPLYYTIQSLGWNYGVGLTPIEVTEWTSYANLMTNEFTWDYARQDHHWWKSSINSTSKSEIHPSGDLKLIALPSTGNYGSCWNYETTGLANGTTYRLKADYSSNFPTNESYFQIMTQSKPDYLTTPIYTNGAGSIDQTFNVYDLVGGAVTLKFCSKGQNLAQQSAATLRHVTFETVSEPVITVKDTTVASNLITNNMTSFGACSSASWCRSYVDNNIIKNKTAITSTGKLRITSSANTGNFGSCWIQNIYGGIANGSTYRLKAQVNSNTFATNVVSIQLQTQSGADYFYMNGTTSTLDETFTVTDASNPNYMAVRFCSSGTGTAAAGATLTKLSLEKLN